MPKGYPSLNKQQKEEITHRIRENGDKVVDLAKEYGVVSKTIYNLLRNKVNEPSLALEVSKLKKERDILLRIVGELFLDSKLAKKK